MNVCVCHCCSRWMEGEHFLALLISRVSPPALMLSIFEHDRLTGSSGRRDRLTDDADERREPLLPFTWSYLLRRPRDRERERRHDSLPRFC